MLGHEQRDVLDRGLGVGALQEYRVNAVHHYLILKVLTEELVCILGGLHLVDKCNVGVCNAGNRVHHSIQKLRVVIDDILILAGDEPCSDGLVTYADTLFALVVHLVQVDFPVLTLGEDNRAVVVGYRGEQPARLGERLLNAH